MNKEKFMYSKKTQQAKGIMKIFSVLPLFLIPLLIISNDFKSIYEYCLAVLVPIFMTFSCVSYLGSWADLEITDKGVYVEFWWKKLLVPWNSIKSIKGSGFGFVRTEVVLVDNQCLTEFHRVYGLFTVGSFNRAFHIHPYFLQPKDLFKLIHKYRSDI